MKKLSIFAALLALMMVGCAENQLDNIEANESAVVEPTDLTAGFADEEQTKTYVENGKYLRWHEADLITAFFGNTLNRQYKFKGKTGDNSGTFKLVPDGELGTGNDLEAIYALYPYNEDATISDEGVMNITLPATQTYAEDSFGKGANTMIAVTAGVEDTFLGFKNVCGYLKLKLYNESGATLKSVEVKGNNGEKIAGSATAAMEFGGVPTVTMATDATTSVTLDCGEGVVLGTSAEEATELWIVLPETTFEGGITITATDTEGITFEKSTTKPVVITRNEIQPMATLGAEFVVPIPKPANNEIWYTATAKVTPYKTDVFGANIVSNEWNSLTLEGVITFDGEVTSIGAWAFSNCTSLASVTIPNSVTEIGWCAFSSCWSLASITIPDSVTSIGDSAFGYCPSLTSTTIPDSVTEIGSRAFYYCESLANFYGKFASEDGKCLIVDGVLNSFAPYGLTEYSIPEGVTSIGDSAFYNCESLANITIPEGVTSIGGWAFQGCSSLAEVYCKPTTPPTGDDYMFYRNASGRKIYVPAESVEAYKTATYWSNYANSIVPMAATQPNNEIWYTATKKVTPYKTNVFGANIVSNEWNSLTLEGVITFDGDVTSIGDWAFSYCWSLASITIPEGVISIGEQAFRECTSLANISIPEGVTSIGEYAFYGCWSLVNISIPEGVTSIGNSAFYDCESLASITIPDGVTSIGDEAFYECSSLASVTIPDSVTEIGVDAFGDCDSLASITIPEGVTSIGDCAFWSCSSLTSITIPEGVTSIGEGAFYWCSSLASVTIGNGVTSIGENAFGYCSSLAEFNGKFASEDGRCLIIDGVLHSFAPYGLTEYSIPEGVTSIGNTASAFYNCSSLVSITIPEGVTSIEESAFRGCSRLAEVYCKATTPPMGGGFNMFAGNASGRKIYVPAESLEAYKTATYWSSYADAIEGYHFE